MGIEVLKFYPILSKDVVVQRYLTQSNNKIMPLRKCK